jgi:hypothetical protein
MTGGGWPQVQLVCEDLQARSTGERVSDIDVGINGRPEDAIHEGDPIFRPALITNEADERSARRHDGHRE